ncbi:Cilia- and flagella-associated protein 74 [Trebouxia sp. C0009 RCD-2024]
MLDLWDDDVFEEPASTYKSHKSRLPAAQHVPHAETQAHSAEYRAQSSDIQHFQELQQAVEQAGTQLESCVEALSLLTLRAGKSEQLMTSMQTELAKMQQEQQQLKMEQPLPVERLKLLEDSIAELAAASEKQSIQLSDAQQSIRRAELDVRAAEDGVLDTAQAQLELQGLASRLAAHQQQSAAARQQQELSGALAHSKQLKWQQQQQVDAVAAAEQSDRSAIAAATAGRKAAALRMKQKLKQLSPTKEAVDTLHKHVRENQQRAAVDLKHHIDAAQAGLADKAEVHQTRAKQQAEMHAKEFNALLESGKNPYAVFRQQAESAKLEQQQQRHVSKVKVKEAVIISQIEAEEQAHERAVAARKAVQQVEARFAKEKGAEAREKRIDRCKNFLPWACSSAA